MATACGSAAPTFRERVLSVVRAIPGGEVRTYGEVARLAGAPAAARAVGAIMRANRDAAVPCHRVVAAGGRLGGYNRGAAQKRRRLRAEGYRGPLADPAPYAREPRGGQLFRSVPRPRA
jgi:O-6-methylguanine DNA methyltransferase